MPSVSMTSLIDAVKAFAHKHDITDDQISDIYILCFKHEHMDKWVGCYITACDVRYNGDASLMVHVGTDGDDPKVPLTFASVEERDRVINEYCGDRDYVYSTVGQKEVVNNLDRSLPALVLRTSPTKDSFSKKVTHYNKPDYRKKNPYTWYTKTERVEYYKLSIFQQK